jgi:hypothetical protein
MFIAGDDDGAKARVSSFIDSLAIFGRVLGFWLRPPLCLLFLR